MIIALGVFSKEGYASQGTLKPLVQSALKSQGFNDVEIDVKGDTKLVGLFKIYMKRDMATSIRKTKEFLQDLKRKYEWGGIISRNGDIKIKIVFTQS